MIKYERKVFVPFLVIAVYKIKKKIHALFLPVNHILTNDHEVVGCLCQVRSEQTINIQLVYQQCKID